MQRRRMSYSGIFGVHHGWSSNAVRSVAMAWVVRTCPGRLLCWSRWSGLAAQPACSVGVDRRVLGTGETTLLERKKATKAKIEDLRGCSGNTLYPFGVVGA